MIQRLVDTLRMLASDADTQFARYPRMLLRGEAADELADVLLLVDSCQQERPDGGQRRAMDAVDRCLAGLTDADEAWTEAALRTDPRWAELRQLAAEALETLRVRPT